MLLISNSSVQTYTKEYLGDKCQRPAISWHQATDPVTRVHCCCCHWPEAGYWSFFGSLYSKLLGSHYLFNASDQHSSNVRLPSEGHHSPPLVKKYPPYPDWTTSHTSWLLKSGWCTQGALIVGGPLLVSQVSNSRRQCHEGRHRLSKSSRQQKGKENWTTAKKVATSRHVSAQNAKRQKSAL